MAKIEVINGNATIDPATGEINVTAEKGVTTKVDTTAAPAPTPGASFTPAPQKGTGAVAPQSSFVPPTCPSCGAPLSSGAHYCSKCGIDISKALPVVFCAKCGKPLPYSEAAYCPSCGAHLLPEHKDQPRPAAAQPGVINVGEPTTKKPDKFKHHAGHILGEGISMLIFLGIAVAILILGGVLDTYPYAVYGLGAAAVLALVAGILAMVQVHAKGKVLGILCFVFMSIANSNFEEWSIANKSFDLSAFPFSLNKMSLDGALFDLDKLSYFAKEMMAKESAASLLPKVKEWALVHNEAFYKRIDSNEAYFAKILNIEKNRPNPRKDYAKFSDIEPLTRFFYYEEWEQIVAKGLPFNPKFQKADLASLLRDLGEHMIYGSDEMTWWAGVKDIAKAHKFAESNKDYKANPSAYLGSVSDAAEILRVSLTGSVQSPNLHVVNPSSASSATSMTLIIVAASGVVTLLLIAGIYLASKKKKARRN